jgi:hypothetical protein
MLRAFQDLLRNLLLFIGKKRLFIYASSICIEELDGLERKAFRSSEIEFDKKLVKYAVNS